MILVVLLPFNIVKDGGCLYLMAIENELPKYYGGFLCLFSMLFLFALIRAVLKYSLHGF